jgi:hypothetical protein
VFRDVRARKLQDSRRSFLADVSTALADSLDYEMTLREQPEVAERIAYARHALAAEVDGARQESRSATNELAHLRIEIVDQELKHHRRPPERQGCIIPERARLEHQGERRAAEDKVE